MTEPINPVTIRGRDYATGKERAISISRLWLGTKDSEDWDKVMTFVIWEDPNDHIVAMCANEDDFIEAVKGFTEFDYSKVTVQGSEKHRHMSLVLRRRFVSEPMRVTIYGGKDKSPRTSVELDYETFMRGLCHLFPKGELAQ